MDVAALAGYSVAMKLTKIAQNHPDHHRGSDSDAEARTCGRDALREAVRREHPARERAGGDGERAWRLAKLAVGFFGGRVAHQRYFCVW